MPPRPHLRHERLAVAGLQKDDAHRNNRFKLIPSIANASWIIQTAVGTKARAAAGVTSLLLRTHIVRARLTVGGKT